MLSRQIEGDAYHCGFNGKENDREVKGDGNQQDYGMRIYDPRMGRFLSVDPLTKDYAELTPYQFASNSPVAGIDLDGGEFKFYALQQKNDGRGGLKLGDQVSVDNDIAFTLVFKVSDPQGTHRVEIPINLDRASVGLSGTFVNYKNTSVRIPDEFDVNNLPPQTDPVWETFQTEQEIDENFIGATYEIAKNVENLSSFRGIVGKSAAGFFTGNGVIQKALSLGSLRRKAVRDAWRQEQQLVKETGNGTRRWSRKEKQELLKDGKVKGYEGDHINSVGSHPEQAGDPNNIQFLRGRRHPKGNEHLNAHDGDYQNQKSGQRINREKMREEHKKKNGNKKL